MLFGNGPLPVLSAIVVPVSVHVADFYLELPYFRRVSFHLLMLRLPLVF